MIKVYLIKYRSIRSIRSNIDIWSIRSKYKKIKRKPILFANKIQSKLERMNIATGDLVLYLRGKHIELILTEYMVLLIALY